LVGEQVLSLSQPFDHRQLDIKVSHNGKVTDFFAPFLTSFAPAQSILARHAITSPVLF
jgi:hypothetical protein